MHALFKKLSNNYTFILFEDHLNCEQMLLSVYIIYKALQHKLSKYFHFRNKNYYFNNRCVYMALLFYKIVRKYEMCS